MKKYGLLMQLPEGKLPGFYAQLVKALAGKTTLFDRDKELLIFDTESDQQTGTEVMGRYRIPYELIDLRLLEQPVTAYPPFDDYGFTSRAGNSFLYDDMAVTFRFADMEAQDAQAALQQLEEHLLARYTLNGAQAYAAPKTLEELIGGIAAAYRISVEFI